MDFEKSGRAIGIEIDGARACYGRRSQPSFGSNKCPACDCGRFGAAEGSIKKGFGESISGKAGEVIGDACDFCPDDPGKVEPGSCDCNTPDTDTDGDSIPGDRGCRDRGCSFRTYRV